MSRYLLPALELAVVLVIVVAVMWRRAERDAVTEARRADAAETKVRHLSERNAELRVELTNFAGGDLPQRMVADLYDMPTTHDREYPL